MGVYAWLAPEEKWEGDDENADDDNIEGNPRNSHAIKVITVDDGPLGIKLINDPNYYKHVKINVNFQGNLEFQHKN